MNDAIHQSISQGEHSENVGKRSRMEQVADELRRRCQLDASKSEDGESDGIGVFEEKEVLRYLDSLVVKGGKPVPPEEDGMHAFVEQKYHL